jgi:hypothetical protein
VKRDGGVLAHRWRSIATLCAFVALFGIAAIVWARIDSESVRADQLAAEADRRGDAVGTLASDVRALRAQIKSEGKTPVAPDPSRAVEGLPQRSEVPVPIPGPSGPKGDPGSPAPTITPSPGASGQPGQDATGAAGQNGQDGADGQDGKNGTDGQDGQPPAGWTWTWTDSDGITHTYSCTPVDDFDADAPRYDCGETSTSSPDPTPQPSPTTPSGLSLLGMVADRRRY